MAQKSKAAAGEKPKRKGKKKEAEQPAADVAAPPAENAEPPTEESPTPSGAAASSESENAASENAVPPPSQGGAGGVSPDDENTAAVSDTPAAEEPVEPPVNKEELARTIEALLFAAEEPIAPREIARASGSDSATVREVLKTIKESYDQNRRPWDIAEVGNGFRLVTRPEFYPAIQRLKTQTAQRKLTQAALETLALIAYRQPIGRADIESVRGVGAGPVLRQLLEKKLIKISGRGTGLGQPLLYGTTDHFLEHFGLKTMQDLPKPGEFKQ